MKDYLGEEQEYLNIENPSLAGRKDWKDFFHKVILTRDRTPLQEYYFHLSQQRETIPIIRTALLCLFILILITWPTDYIFFDEIMIEVYFLWRIVMISLIIVVLALLQFFIWARKNAYTITFIGILGGIFFSGYLFGQLRDLTTPWFYFIFLLPIITVFFNTKILWRILATILVPAAYATGFLILNPHNLNYEHLGVTFNFGISAIVISILLGHVIYYQNRQNFFQQHQLKKQQKEIQKLADYDQLTGLYNRREFENRAQEEFMRALRYNNPLSVLMIDFDYFKKINDDYGHSIGDNVLKVFGEIIDSCSRSSDIAGRYGGEEFTMLLPETNSEGAMQMADRLRTKLAEFIFENDRGETFNVTCSIGIAEWTPELKSYEEILKKADDALYQAKLNGRNQVKLAAS